MYVACGMFVAVALLAAKLWFEQTQVGREVEYLTRSYLLRLLPAFREEGADVVVLDISHLRGGTRDRTTLRAVPTPRADLKALLVQLEGLAPAAIGIDVDFSGESYGWIDPRDPEFFDYCLELNKRIPVRLGVSRSVPSPDGLWLISPKYSKLAAAIYVGDTDSGSMPISVGLEGSRHRIMTLGASLAAAAKSGSWDPLALKTDGHRAVNWVFDEAVHQSNPIPPTSMVLETVEAPVNFSSVRQLGREYIPQVQPQDLARYESRIKGRVVIIGDVENHGDVHPIPGDRVDRSGVLLHAAQVQTFTSEPVYVFGHSFRICLDLLIPALIMVGVLSSRHLLREQAASVKLQWESRIVQGFAVGIVLLSLFLTAYYRIFWLDFVLVLAFLLIHRRIEHALLHKLSPSEDGHEK